MQALKARRKAKDLTSAAVAEAASVPLDTVRAIESGRSLTPSFMTVAAIARAIGISLDELARIGWGEGRRPR